jgi:hypothetical protein
MYIPVRQCYMVIMTEKIADIWPYKYDNLTKESVHSASSFQSCSQVLDDCIMVYTVLFSVNAFVAEMR